MGGRPRGLSVVLIVPCGKVNWIWTDMDDSEEASDPRTPLPSYGFDEDAITFLDAPRTTASTSAPTTTHGAKKNPPLDTTLTARSARFGDDMKNPDPATSDVVPTDPPPPPPKKSRLTRPVIIGLACCGLALGAALVRLLVR